jgi:hypothetical protein
MLQQHNSPKTRHLTTASRRWIRRRVGLQYEVVRDNEPFICSARMQRVVFQVARDVNYVTIVRFFLCFMGELIFSLLFDYFYLYIDFLKFTVIRLQLERHDSSSR